MKVLEIVEGSPLEGGALIKVALGEGGIVAYPDQEMLEGLEMSAVAPEAASKNQSPPIKLKFLLQSMTRLPEAFEHELQSLKLSVDLKSKP